MSVEERITALEHELARLRGEMAEDGGAATLDRRTALRRAGTVAAGAVAGLAGLAALRPEDAAASSGQNVVLGITNDGGQPTTVQNTPTLSPNPIFLVHESGIGQASAYNAAFGGWGKDKVGVYAFSHTSRGLVAVGNTDSAVPLFLRPKGATPSTGPHEIGELLLLTDGSLVTCIGQGDGTNAKWARVGYNPLNPQRLVDTRAGTGAPKAAVGPAGTINVQVHGVAGVPTAARAVVLTLTGTGPTAGTYLTVYPDGIAVPPTSNLNLVKGQTLATEVTAKVGANGKVRVRNNAGSTHIVLDVAGYFV